MIARVLPPNPTLADRFGNLLYWLFEGMALDWRRRGVTHVHALEISLRVHGLWKRVHRVLEAWRAGTLRVARARVRDVTPPLSPPSRGGGRETHRVCAWGVLPRRFGWLKSLFSLDSVYHVNAFHPLIHEDAEMQAIIAAAPGPIGRALRPFCHLLGLAVPEALLLPKRVRKAGSAAQLRQRRRDERSDLIIPNRRLPPKEQAEDAMRRSEATGKPIAVKKFSAAANGCFLHMPRDGNCPPPEIGYGGRLRPLPKDYNPPKDWE